MRKKFPIILLILLLAALIYECAGLSDSGKHGSSYEDSCGLLKQKLLAVQGIGVTIAPITDPLSSEGCGVSRRYRMDYSQRVAYIEKNYGDLTRAIKRFKSKKMEFETRFRDDVEIVEALYYLSLSMPGSKAIPEFYKKAERIIGSGEILDLEAETAESFKEIKQFRLFSDPEIWDRSGEHLVAELVQKNDFEGILIHALVGAAFMDDMNIGKANELINEYRNLLGEDHLHWLQQVASNAGVSLR